METKRNGRTMIEHKDLITTVNRAITEAVSRKSRLPPEAATIRGMTSPKIRHLLNNLCAMPNTVYVEMGLYKGATFVAALAGNEDTVKTAYGIDNWSLFPSHLPRERFWEHHAKYLSAFGSRLHIHDTSLFDISPDAIAEPVTIFYYDADHIHTHKAVLKFLPRLADPCIIILDDWSRPEIRNDWEKIKAEVTVHKEWELYSYVKDDLDHWWCGLFLAVITKKQ